MEYDSMEIRHECPICTEQYEEFSRALNCYRHHPAEKAINRIGGDKSKRNLVKIVQRHSEGVPESELRRLQAWLRDELDN